MEIDPLSKLYVLDHTHEVYFDKHELPRKFLGKKLIGIFDSSEKALITLENYKNVKGFKDSIDGFRIDEYIVDSIYNEHINIILKKHLSDKTLKKVHGLYYVFEHPNGYEDINLLGLFSSKLASQAAKNCLISDSRFAKFSDNINSFEHQINMPQWEEGFISWKPTSKERADWGLD